MNRAELFSKYIRNDRIKDYDEILSLAKNKKYEIISLEKYIDNDYKYGKNILILRHDIDHITEGTDMMFEAEKKHGAFASYYFRKVTANFNMMKKIKSYGSEASLHFETIAEFIQTRGITKKEELTSVDFKAICLNILENDLENFRCIYEVPCNTIASHGAEENRKFAVSNNVLTENESVYEKLKIGLEAYNKNFIDSIENYISDCPIEMNSGYRYEISPVEAIEKGMSPILFLSHPNHWYYTYLQQARKLIKTLLISPINNKETFKRIKG